MWKIITWLAVLILVVNQLGLQENPLISKTQESGVQLIPFLGHNDSISYIALSSDGKFALTGDNENLIILWQLENQYSLRSFTGHSGTITGLVFSKDNNYFFSSSVDGTIRKWDIRTGHQVFAIESRCPLFSLSIDNREEKAVCGVDYRGNSFLLFDLTGTSQNKKSEKSLSGLREVIGSVNSNPNLPNKNRAKFIDDGNKIISSVDFLKLYISNTSSKKVAGELKLRKTEILDFKPVKNGLYVLTSYKNGSIALWNTLSFDTIRTYKGNKTPVTSLAVSSDGSFFIGAISNNELIIWNINNGSIIKKLATSVNISNLVLDITNKNVYGSDGKLILGYNIENGSLKMALVRGDLFDYSNSTAYPKVARFSPSNKYIIIGTLRNEILVWDIEKGKLKKRIKNGSGHINDIHFRYGDDEIITNSSDSLISFRNIENEIPEMNVRSLDGVPTSISYSQENNILVFNTDEEIKIVGMDLINKKLERRAIQNDPDLLYSSKGIFYKNNMVICGTSPCGFVHWDLKTGRFQLKHISKNDYLGGIDLSSDGKYLLTGSKNGQIDCWDTKTFNNVASRIILPEISAMKIAPDNKSLVLAGMYKILRVSIPDFNIIKEYPGLDAYVNCLDISCDNNKLMSACADGKIHIWDMNTGKQLITIIAMDNNGWFAYTPDGYFDTDVIESLGEVKWVFSDEPMKGYPAELYMRDFYQPNLLRKVINNDMVTPIAKIENKSRNIPEVSLSLQDYMVGDDTIIVHVKSEYLKTQNSSADYSGFYDLRIFRDGQLVDQYPDESESYENSNKENQEIDLWRKKMEIKVNADEQFIMKNFRIKIPYKKGKNTQISAYLFNKDRVKSETAKFEVKRPDHISPKKGLVYLINIGVANNMSFLYRLLFSADDAILLGDKLDGILRNNKNYEKIIPVCLVSERIKRTDPKYQSLIIPTKEKIKNTLSILAHSTTRKSDINYAENSGNIKPACPNDLVIISYHGHGVMDNNQMFYFVPYDANYEQVIHQNYSSLISASELADWTKHIDAGKIIMIIDACYSASAIEDEWFKPGPFGNKGLGQIAYDKGILVLVASQKDQTAEELGNGILTYTFLKENLLDKQTNTNKKYSIIDLLRYVEVNTPIVLKNKGIGGIQEPKLYIFPKEDTTFYEPIYISGN